MDDKLESKTEVPPSSASTMEPLDDLTELEGVPLSPEEGSELEDSLPKIHGR
jgi:hypothetical protein